MYTYYGIGLIQFHRALRLYVFLQSGIERTLSIWYATLHFRDQRGTASLRYRNRAKITVLMCEQKPYSAWFSCMRKSYPVECEHLTDVWLSTLEIFAPLQKSRQNHRSYVWTEALFGMVFVHAQKLSGRVWTPNWCVTLHFRDFRSVTEIAPKSPFLCVNRSPIRYGFRVGKKATRYSMNIALITGLWKRKYFRLHLLIRASCFVQVVNFL